MRSGPGIEYSLLGQINQGLPVQITAVDASKEWLAINYPSGPKGYGWVTTQYIQASGLDNLPVIGLVTLPNGTPAPQAHLTQKLFVRSGPGTPYDSLGILPADALVWLIGRNESASWLMIDYPPGPDGKGWVIAGYIKADAILDLPVFDATGAPLVATPVSQGTMIVSTPTPFIGPAFQDGDSLNDPSARVVFSPLGIRSFNFFSDLSSPQGDQEDWIAFRPYSSKPGAIASLSASLTCTGNGSINVEIIKGIQQVSNWGTLSCGNTNTILTLIGGFDYSIHLTIQGNNDQRYVLYSLTLRNDP